MKGKAGEKRGAKVRVSRAKSRVAARKRGAAISRVAAGRPRRGGDPAPGDLPAADRPREAGGTPKRARGKSRGGDAGRRAKDAQPRDTQARVKEDAAGGTAAEGDARKREGKEERRRTRARARGSGGKERAAGEAAPAGGERSRRGGPAGRRRWLAAPSPARTAVLGAVLVASLAALLWVYTNTGVLNVKRVEVRGNERLDAAYLRFLSGITADTHWLKMDVKAVEEALLSEPYVEAARVSRRYPHTVVLEITERRPAAFVTQNGAYQIVDQMGTVLESVRNRPPGLVEIEGLELPLLLPGARIDGQEFASVTSLLGSLPTALREMATSAGVREGEGLYLEAMGTVVIYGEASDFGRKNEIALLALTGLMERYGSLEYIDVSFPDRPVIKPLGSDQVSAV